MSFRKKALASLALTGSLLVSACSAEDIQSFIDSGSSQSSQVEATSAAVGNKGHVLEDGTEATSNKEKAKWAAGKPLTDSDSFNGSVKDSYSHLFSSRKIIKADICDTSGDRKPNAAVHIGATDNRDYWGFTNENGQLVYVVGAKIIVQDDNAEKVNSSGRYCNKMADVEGVGKKYGRDRGHVIADSLGGVSNAYNITPQDAHLNRHGDQAYMEDSIRKAGGADQFEAIITYPDAQTQVPDNYIYRYTIAGNRVIDNFPNGKK